MPKSLKCAECDKGAVYVFEGHSVCSEHLKELKEKVADMKTKMNFVLKHSLERIGGGEDFVV